MSYTVKNQWLFCFLLLFVLEAGCQEKKLTDLSKELSKIAELGYLPGYAVAIVKTDSILYQNAFGYADLEDKRPFTTNTIQSVASVSKTAIGFCILKLVEDGKLALDTPINDVLPFDVHNPNFKADLITVGHLATHTSGILDTENSYDSRGRYFIPQTHIDKENVPEDWLVYFDSYRANSKISLQELCQNTLSKDGEWYSDETFSSYKTGTHYQYSNLGANLAAYIVELISGKPFFEYTKENIFHKLAMNDAAWNIQEVDENRLATSYVSEELIPTPFFGNSAYADGGLYTTCTDLSIYLTEMIKGYYGESDLMLADSFKQLFAAQLPEGLTQQSNQKKIVNSGVFWMHSPDGDLFHNGGNPLGGTIYMWFDPKSGIGRILMTNYLVEDKNAYLQFMSIWKALDNHSLKH